MNYSYVSAPDCAAGMYGQISAYIRPGGLVCVADRRILRSGDSVYANRTAHQRNTSADVQQHLLQGQEQAPSQPLGLGWSCTCGAALYVSFPTCYMLELIALQWSSSLLWVR